MIILNYQNNKFTLSLNKFLDPEEFQEVLSFCRKHYLIYNNENKYWIIDSSEVEEFMFFLKKENFEYSTTENFLNAFQEKKSSYKRETEFYRNLSLNKDILYKDITLFKFQEEGINWGVKRSRLYIADDPGLGKTIQSLSIFFTWYKEGLLDSLFLIVRNGLSYNWMKEITLNFNVFKEEDIYIIENVNKIKPFENIKNKKCIIIPNHLLADVLASYRNDYKDLKKLSTIRWNKPFLDIKKEWGKNKIGLIIDEAHELKDNNSLRTKACLSVKNFFDNRILLSATPAINYFEDWWTGMNIIDESIIPMSKNLFKLKIAEKIGDKFDKYAIKTYNIDEIKKIQDAMSKYVLKRLKSDIPEMKTKQIVKPIFLKMTDIQREIYLKFFEYEILKLEDEYDYINYKLIFNKFPYYLQIIDNPNLLKGKVFNDRLNVLLDKWDPVKHDVRISYIDETLNLYIKENKEKVIIFDTHPKTLDFLFNRYKKYNPVIIHGQTGDDQKERQYKQDLFNDKNSECKLFLLQTAVGGAGFNFHYACRRIIFFSLPYDATLLAQAKDRVWRITSEQDSIVEILLLDHSVDISRYDLVNNRIKLNNEFLSKDFNAEKLKELMNGEKSFFSSLY